MTGRVCGSDRGKDGCEDPEADGAWHLPARKQEELQPGVEGAWDRGSGARHLSAVRYTVRCVKGSLLSGAGDSKCIPLSHFLIYCKETLDKKKGT